MRRAICPGSFDPVTNGHIDIFERASLMFDEIIISVFNNPGKAQGMFTMDERVAMLKEATKHIANAKVTCFSGLLNEYCKQQNTKFIVRGLRAFSDFEYEFQMAGMNRNLYPEVETLFLTPSEQYTFISATMVREIAILGGDVSKFVRPSVKERLARKVAA